MTPNNGIPYMQFCNMDERTNEEVLRDNLLMKDKFNRYCAGVIGYSESQIGVDDEREILDIYYLPIGKGWIEIGNYNPYDDLNQMKGPFNKLNNETGHDVEARRFQLDVFVKGMNIEEAMRAFIESTMPSDQPSKPSEG